MQYVSTAGSQPACFFCDHLEAGDDEKVHILYRAEKTFVLLNAFPYNTGHVMIAPFRHVADLSEMTGDERAELMDVTYRATDAIDGAMNPQGFNIGINLGIAGGAGVPGHLHMHVVPRWGADTNFMTTVGDTKVLPEMLGETDAKLRPIFERLNEG
jgi:ATP adenylyltransferase